MHTNCNHTFTKMNFISCTKQTIFRTLSSTQLFDHYNRTLPYFLYDLGAVQYDIWFLTFRENVQQDTYMMVSVHAVRSMKYSRPVTCFLSMQPYTNTFLSIFLVSRSLKDSETHSNFKYPAISDAQPPKNREVKLKSGWCTEIFNILYNAICDDVL